MRCESQLEGIHGKLELYADTLEELFHCPRPGARRDQELETPSQQAAGYSSMREDFVASNSWQRGCRCSRPLELRRASLSAAANPIDRQLRLLLRDDLSTTAFQLIASQLELKRRRLRAARAVAMVSGTDADNRGRRL